MSDLTVIVMNKSQSTKYAICCTGLKIIQFCALRHAHHSTILPFEVASSKIAVPTSQRTQYVFITKFSQLKRFRETIAVYFDNNTKYGKADYRVLKC